MAVTGIIRKGALLTWFVLAYSGAVVQYLLVVD